MTGDETKEELDRCRVWDIVVRDGPQRMHRLSNSTRISYARLKRLVTHPWFDVDEYEFIRIART